MKARIRTFWDRQHIHPQGLAGLIVGERMVRQHRIETLWTLSLLNVQPTHRVLEIGFGAGVGLAHVAAQATAGYVVGIDVSRTMLAQARRRNQTALRERRMGVLQADVADLPFGEAQFDRIFSIHTYYFWSDAPAVVAQLRRILRPGGMFVVTMATGIVGNTGEVDTSIFGGMHDKLEALVLTMRDEGWSEARLERGPNNRQYNNVALVGVR